MKIEDHAKKYIEEIVGGKSCQTCEFYYYDAGSHNCILEGRQDVQFYAGNMCPAFIAMIDEMIAESPVWVRAIKRERG